MELPVFYLDIEENGDSEVDYVALVDAPAIKINWQKFSEEKKYLFTSDAEKKVISGMLMVADMPIYRRDESGREYYVIFKPETIEKIVQKFFKKGYQSNVNLMHDTKKIVDGISMFESFIVDKAAGKPAPKGFEDIQYGWYGSFKVDNTEVWDLVREDKLQGFSVEGLFKYEHQQSDEESLLREIKKLVDQIPI